jgi:Fe-S-cluster-containing hydrogenase component 2
MESGCPALVMVGDYPRIRDWECIGCDICAQLCPVDAIFPVSAEAGAPPAGTGVQTGAQAPDAETPAADPGTPATEA